MHSFFRDAKMYLKCGEIHYKMASYLSWTPVSKRWSWKEGLLGSFWCKTGRELTWSRCEGLTQCDKEERKVVSSAGGGAAVLIFEEWAGLETLFLNIYWVFTACKAVSQQTWLHFADTIQTGGYTPRSQSKWRWGALHGGSVPLRYAPPVVSAGLLVLAVNAGNLGECLPPIVFLVFLFPCLICFSWIFLSQTAYLCSKILMIL